MKNFLNISQIHHHITIIVLDGEQILGGNWNHPSTYNSSHSTSLPNAKSEALQSNPIPVPTSRLGYWHSDPQTIRISLRWEKK